MEIIRTLRKKAQTRREEDIHNQAENLIRLSDFANSLYIAYEGTPLVPIEEGWTTKEIVQKLSEVRQNYINAKIKEIC